MKRIGVALTLITSLCVLGAGPADAGLCGKTIIKNLTLRSDLHCRRAGLIVGADNVVINLHHFTIYGAHNGFDGINVVGWNNVTIKNGTVSHFDNGIFFDGATNGFITHVTVSTGGFDGITLKTGSDGNQLTSDVIKAFDGDGVFITQAASNTLTNVASKKNSGHGFELVGAATTGTTLTNDQARHNEGQGFLLNFSSAGTTITGAIATTNGGAGVTFATSDTGSTVANSTSNNNQSYGFAANDPLQDGGGNTASGNNGGDANQQCVNVVCS